MSLQEDVKRAAETTRIWRAQYLMDAAKRLDRQAEELRKQAAEYRETARKLNPTQS